MSSHINVIDTKFQVTPLATRQMAKYFEDREISPVRILFNSGG